MCIEVKNFASNNKHRLLEVSHILESVQREEVSTRSSPIGDWCKCSIVSWYFGIFLDSGKIPCTSNRLILD